MKSLGEFYVHAMMRDGHLNFCKECVRRRVGKHRAANISSIREYDRSRSKLTHRKAKAMAVSKQWRARGPAARAAHSLTHHALRDGRLKRGKCEACGSLRVHAHHDDYLKPLQVRWLCAEHHKQWHLQNGPGLNAKALTKRQALKLERSATP